MSVANPSWRVLAMALLVMLAVVRPASATMRSISPLACDGSWQIEPSPNVTQGENSLTAVDAISSSDVWAVGGKQPDTGPKPLTEHWDGTAWGVVQTPYVGDGVLMSVSAVS